MTHLSENPGFQVNSWIYMLQISHNEGEEESDIFNIREVSFQPEGDDDWKETSYTLNTDSLDWVRAETGDGRLNKEQTVQPMTVTPMFLLRRCMTT